nr:hypothetical protein BaRGS_007241 [Batillaria attramentaria]
MEEDEDDNEEDDGEDEDEEDEKGEEEEEGIRLAKETSHLAGDSWQQGGTVLLDKNQKILYQHTEEHPADWPSMEEVLQLVGVSDKKVDYKKALEEWLKAREENRARQ